MSFSQYYRAHVVEKECWFLVAVLRSFEHLAFDRTYDKQTSTFEFFVPEGCEETFLTIMAYFTQQGVITSLQKLPNRLLDPDAGV
jgi:hypothetical protein